MKLVEMEVSVGGGGGRGTSWVQALGEEQSYGLRGCMLLELAQGFNYIYLSNQVMSYLVPYIHGAEGPGDFACIISQKSPQQNDCPLPSPKAASSLQ